ncbi:hypothetical protein BpJC7_12680 [Weizmannia acidilactici]|uniref:Uncharacterized protein n=1 Tax=Weizmannia acidilactici TaxID=2607726 RepID=A0A5J4JH37_9BACI|nr:hypothetical protein [Weizmannia acidilactici]GER69965.1 hypothetical protein BpJC7_12680 [Weizmannia acidilactici]GER73102.1 hypothetical protein BpPP18_11690 [Weizmannia acidilactici]
MKEVEVWNIYAADMRKAATNWVAVLIFGLDAKNRSAACRTLRKKRKESGLFE